VQHRLRLAGRRKDKSTTAYLTTYEIESVVRDSVRDTAMSEHTYCPSVTSYCGDSAYRVCPKIVKDQARPARETTGVYWASPECLDDGGAINSNILKGNHLTRLRTPGHARVPKWTRMSRKELVHWSASGTVPGTADAAIRHMRGSEHGVQRMAWP
jgi:hypothetical protein